MSSLLGGDDALLLKVRNDLLDGLGDVDLVRLDVDLGVLGGLVWRADAGELLDLARARLLVQALGVALLDDRDGSVDEDLDEGEGRVVLGVQLARKLAVRNVRRDEGRQGEGARGGEEEGDLADTTDLTLAVASGGPRPVCVPSSFPAISQRSPLPVRSQLGHGEDSAAEHLHGPPAPVGAFGG